MNSVKPGLVAAWIQYQSIYKSKTAEVDELEWAMTELLDMCRLDPESAWFTILEIIAKDSSDTILADVGAGPTEDLLGFHVALVIDRVESCARSNPSFHRMLGIVWKNAISDEVWQRVKAIAPPSW
jgi:hypothetical protein